jgi:hypothetical protein
MKLAGFLLLAAGWGIVVAALLLLHSAGSILVFILAGFAVQILGMILAIRSHRLTELERG